MKKTISEMAVNGLKCTFNMPNAITPTKINNEEIASPLPPYDIQEVYPVDDYPECPPNWMHGSDNASSYFVAIEEGKGMWLDFNQNSNHKHDVAVLISVQGINPITGMKTDKMCLEKYGKKCPKHDDTEFQQDRFCPKCAYKWPAQNYMSTTGQHRGLLWLDGFRAEDGVVRQYIFTAEEAKGVAAQIIGSDRVFAIGVAMFLSKEPKKEITYRSAGIYESLKCCDSYGGSAKYSSGEIKTCSAESLHWSAPKSVTNSAPQAACLSNTKDIAQFKRISIPLERKMEGKGDVDRHEELHEESEEKTYEIGAGAKINQVIMPDPMELSYWQETPHFIYINYVDKKTCQKIINAGKRDTTKGGEGFLADIVKAK